MTYTEIGVRLVVLLLVVGVYRNIIGPALKRAYLWTNEILGSLNGDTYVDRKGGWE